MQSATRFQHSSSDVVCAKLFPLWPGRLCCKSTEVGPGVLGQEQQWDGPDNVAYIKGVPNNHTSGQWCARTSVAHDAPLIRLHGHNCDERVREMKFLLCSGPPAQLLPRQVCWASFDEFSDKIIQCTFLPFCWWKFSHHLSCIPPLYCLQCFKIGRDFLAHSVQLRTP